MSEIILKNTEVSDRKRGMYAPDTLEVYEQSPSIVVALRTKGAPTCILEMGRADAKALRDGLNDILGNNS